MAELRPIIVFHSRHFVRHLGICNPICVKLLLVMFGVIPSNLKKRRLYLKPFSWGPQTRHTHTNRYIQTHTHIHAERDTHTHTHDDSIRRNAMRCISPKNKLRTTTSLSQKLEILLNELRQIYEYVYYARRQNNKTMHFLVVTLNA